ncbi:hypothetical protein H072_2371 [Dactylellina haptotyla CBS 200.50]|uniref:NAD(P)-binding protein n=1 Tax=Dactylellina haptotyla (strain CBS 200.50) TaxID=1284197 RepID=S8C7E1_DACHA|nr:hypothetical protein H072_2371 [Dactylellina haptotyla CBS 200.50]
MIPLTTIQAANATLSTSLPSPVCVFVGGTTGIGFYTLKKLAAATVSPKVYYIGRTPSNAEIVQKELQKINPKGTYKFLKCDVLLTQSVDECCHEILKQEKEINILWLSAGVLRSGMPDTAEGIEFMAAISYYGQIKFIPNLLPLLKASAANGHHARVIRILAGGREKALDPNNLDMRDMGLIPSRVAHTTITTVAFDYLAKENPDVSFIHAFAGFVKTEGQNFPGVMSMVIRTAMYVAGWLFLVPEEESGERNLFYSTSDIYPPGLTGPAEAQKREEKGVEGEDIAVGLDGIKGSGCYTLNWDGEAKSGNPILLGYREDGFREKVWEHTLEVWKKAEEAHQRVEL